MFVDKCADEKDGEQHVAFGHGHHGEGCREPRRDHADHAALPLLEGHDAVVQGRQLVLHGAVFLFARGEDERGVEPLVQEPVLLPQGGDL